MVVDGFATNIRVPVQITGTERAPNADGSFCIPVDRTDLSYPLQLLYGLVHASLGPTTAAF
jgi:hypothetical protein